MSHFMKIFFVFLILLFLVHTTMAQQLSNVFITQDGKAAYRISLNSIYVVLSEKGFLSEVKTSANGTIVYNIANKVEQIGDVKIGYNYQGFVNLIGTAPILYDFSGRVDRIGTVGVRYNYNGLIAEIGNQKVLYSADNRIDQFDSFKIYYNYNKMVQRIDESRGLILLQLNYEKSK